MKFESGNHCPPYHFWRYKYGEPRESADYPAESSMLLKPHCVSSIPIRFHGCRELAPQIRSSPNGIATPVLEKRRQQLSLLSRIFLTLAWLRYRPTTHFAKSRFKCGMGQVHFQSSRNVWHCNARFLTFFGCHAPLFPPENLLACSLSLSLSLRTERSRVKLRKHSFPNALSSSAREIYIIHIRSGNNWNTNIQYVRMHSRLKSEIYFEANLSFRYTLCKCKFLYRYLYSFIRTFYRIPRSKKY